MKTRLILDINKTQYAQLNSLVTGRVGDKASNTVDVYVVDGFIPYNLTGSDVYFECAKPDNTSVRDKNGITMIDAAKGHFEYTFPTQTFTAVGKSKQAYFSIEKNSTVKATTQDFIIVSLPDALTNRIPSQTYISQLEELIWQLEQIQLDLLNSEAYKEAHDAKTFAEQAKSISESVKAQLDQIVINSSIDPETKQARVDSNGVAFPLLKDRIDADQKKIENINKKANSEEVNVKFPPVPYVAVKGDGTEDAADIDRINSLIQNFTKVFVPEGNYNVPTDKRVLFTSDTEVYGIRGKTKFIKSGGVSIDSIFSIISPYTTPADSLKNISIHNLSFEGNVSTLGFAEFNHIIEVRGVNGLDVYNCDIIGFRGDGICLGVENGQVPDGTEHRRNSNVNIYNNFIDGVNKQNRNGVSIISGDNVKVYDNIIRRTTQFNMPGAIDIEPNPYAGYTIKNIEVFNNNINDIGGNVAAISVFCPGPNKPNNISIYNNTIRNVYKNFHIEVFNNTESNIKVRNNDCKTTSNIGLLVIGELSKFHFENNIMLDVKNIGISLGFDSEKDLTLKDSFLEKNTVQTTGNYFLLRTRTIDNVKMQKNLLIGDTTSTFVSVGYSGGYTNKFNFDKNTLVMSNTPQYVITSTGSFDLLNNTFDENNINVELDAADTLFALNKNRTMQGTINKLDGNTSLMNFPVGKSSLIINSGTGMPITGTGLLETVRIEGRSQTAYRNISYQLFTSRGQLVQYIRFWTDGTSSWGTWSKINTQYSPNVSSTAGRPTAPVVGQQHYDSTLNKPIWCKTSSPVVWIDAIGTVV